MTAPVIAIIEYRIIYSFISFYHFNFSFNFHYNFHYLYYFAYNHSNSYYFFTNHQYLHTTALTPMVFIIPNLHSQYCCIYYSLEIIIYFIYIFNSSVHHHHNFQYFTLIYLIYVSKYLISYYQ